MYYIYFDRIFTAGKCEPSPVAPVFNEPEGTAAKTTEAAQSGSLQEPVKADNSQPGGKFSKIAVSLAPILKLCYTKKNSYE